MARSLWLAAAIAGFTAVAAGAFGAHALRDRFDARSLDIYETAARYQMYHAVAALIAAALASRLGSGAIVAGWIFIAGIVVFSGSLYLLSFTGIRWLGAITPVGGVLFLGAWAIFAHAGLRHL